MAANLQNESIIPNQFNIQIMSQGVGTKKEKTGADSHTSCDDLVCYLATVTVALYGTGGDKTTAFHPTSNNWPDFNSVYCTGSSLDDKAGTYHIKCQQNCHLQIQSAKLRLQWRRQ
jgi:hypothetical protein